MRGVRDGFIRMGLLFVLLGPTAPCHSAPLCDGTNVWVGAASGGSWSDVRNWRAVSAAGWRVPELFARYAVYDLRGLSPGAVVTFDYAGGNVYNVQNTAGQMFISGLVAAGAPGDVWTVAKGTDAKVRFVKDAVLDVSGGRLDFHAPTDTGFSYPTMPFVKRGDGVQFLRARTLPRGRRTRHGRGCRATGLGWRLALRVDARRGGTDNGSEPLSVFHSLQGRMGYVFAQATSPTTIPLVN